MKESPVRVREDIAPVRKSTCEKDKRKSTNTSSYQLHAMLNTNQTQMYTNKINAEENRTKQAFLRHKFNQQQWDNSINRFQ